MLKGTGYLGSFINKTRLSGCTFLKKNDQCDVFQVNNIVYNKPLDVRQLNFTINEQIDAQAILLVHCTLRNICTLKHFLLGICDSKAGSILCSTQKKCDEANLKSRDFYKHSALARSTNAPQHIESN